MGVFVIGISASETGAQSGKDTFSNIIADSFQYNNIVKKVFTYHLADPLKKSCAELFEFKESLCHDNKDAATMCKWPSSNIYGKSGIMTVREVLQYIGTDVCRAMFDDLWIYKLQLFINKKKEMSVNFNENYLILVPDIRFQNEYQCVDFLFDIKRPSLGKKSGHPSEHSLNIGNHSNISNNVEFVLNDGTIEDLKTKVYNQYHKMITDKVRKSNNGK